MKQRGGTRASWKILALLASFSLVNYMARTNVSIAAKFMMPELGLTQIEIGQVFSAFMLAYALFQIPGGVAGDRLGPRRVLTFAAAAWGVLTVLTGLVPGLLITSAAAAFGSLLALRFLLGAAEAASYPVSTRAVASWIPLDRRAFANSIVTAGMAVGSAFTPPLISWLMVTLGWRQSFYITAAAPAIIGVLWWVYAPHSGAPAPLVPQAVPGGTSGRKWWALVRNRNMALISISYFLESYIQYIFLFWFFLYLVNVRGFTVLKGGFLTSLPYVVAMISMPVAGYLSDRLSRTMGKRRGRCAVVLAGFLGSAAFLIWCARTPDPYVAVIGVSFSVGLVLSTEGTFWATATDVAEGQEGAAGGIMNTAGNLAGVPATSLVPILVHYFGWSFVFVSSAGLSVAAGLIWLAIRFPRAQVEPERATAEGLRLSWESQQIS